MRKHLLGITTLLLFQFLAFVQADAVFAQTFSPTPGLIYKPATNGGNKILDPNGDGYVSPTKYGFIGGDEGTAYSEIAYKPFPVFMDEPLSDISTGAKGGHTDYAPKVYEGTKPVGSPLAAHFDGTNFLFRIRLGGQSTASKGYSILIDANNTLTGTGKNPGFEYEVVLCTNFDVRVYYHGADFTKEGPVIFNGSVDQYSQKAIALSMGDTNPDYFYDFYVPLSVFNQAPHQIIATTPLRMTGVTVTSAKSGLFGVASDIGGVDDTKYSGNFIGALSDIINNTPTTTPTGIQGSGFTPIKAAAPYVNGPITKNGSTVTITGYSVEKAGSVITVYQNNIAIGTALVLADGTWSLQVVDAVLIADRTITATVKPDDKTVSDPSNSVKVQRISCFTTIPPSITGVSSNNKSIEGTTTTGGTITLYRVGSQEAEGSVFVPAGGGFSATYGKPGDIPSGTYYVTLTIDGCESLSSNQLCYVAGSGSHAVKFMTVEPSISPSTITSSSATITVTGPAGSTLTLSKNGVQIDSRVLTSLQTTWTVNLTGLNHNDVLYARATLSSSTCSATSGRSNAATVSSTSTPVQSTAPVINGNYCGATTRVSGSSTEAPGTTIKLFNGNTQVGTTTTDAFGSWSITIASTTSGTLTATATAPNKTESALSSPVTIGALYTGITPAISTNVPVIEGATTLKGTATSGAIITLYINGDPYVRATGTEPGSVITTTTNASGAWEFTNISPFDFYPGAKLTVTAKASVTSTCESAHSVAVPVQCKPASTGMTSSFSNTAVVMSTTICPGTRASVYLSTSEIGTIYNVFRKNTAGNYSLFGPSIVGTGKPLVLESDLVTTSGTILQVRTMKVGADCMLNVGSELTVNLYPAVPKNYQVLVSPTGLVCPNSSVTITVVQAEKDYSYQLVKIVGTTRQNIGSALLPTVNGNISFPATTVAEKTQLGVVVRSTITNCMDENVMLIEVDVVANGPIVNQAITSSTSAVCVGGSATFAFDGETGATYSLTDLNGNTISGSSVSLSGGRVTISTGTTATATEGTKNFRIRVVKGSCDTFLTAEPSLVVSNGPVVPVSAGNARKLCGRTFQLEGSDPAPGNGEWVVTGPDGIQLPNSIFTDRTRRNTSVTVPGSGVYIFTWTVTSTCTNAKSSSTVFITVNCDATFSTGSTKFFDEYLINENLVTITDIDGGIADHKILSGIRPPGSSFILENGTLYLRVTGPLTPGGYTLGVQTKDAHGFTTDLAMFVRIYNREQLPGSVTPLPVELMYLKAAVQAREVVLNWQTASEKDNDRFEIQRSADGKTFTTIATEKGNGTTSKSIKYSFTDTNPFTGVSYYRLKQIDFDGKSAFSPTVSANISALEKGAALQTIKADPNPFTSELNVVVHAATEGEASIMLYNLQGRCILKQDIKMVYGTNNYLITSPPGETGMYIMKVVGNGINSSMKLVKAD